MEYGLFGLIVLIADIYAIIKTLQSRVDTLPKVLWIVGIIVFPILGFIVWLLAGPKGTGRISI